jgi:hypothetical protein
MPALLEIKIAGNSYWTRLNAASRYAVRRLALKLGMLFVFAATEAGTSYGAGRGLSLMLDFAGMVDVLIALFQRTSPFGSTLSYWDEAAVFFMLSIAMRWFL